MSSNNEDVKGEEVAPSRLFTGLPTEVGLVPTILGMLAIYLAVTVSMFFNPALRQMDVGRER